MVGKDAVFSRAATDDEILIARVAHAAMLPALHPQEVDDT